MKLTLLKLIDGGRPLQVTTITHLEAQPRNHLSITFIVHITWRRDGVCCYSDHPIGRPIIVEAVILFTKSSSTIIHQLSICWTSTNIESLHTPPSSLMLDNICLAEIFDVFDAFTIETLIASGSTERLNGYSSSFCFYFSFPLFFYFFCLQGFTEKIKAIPFSDCVQVTKSCFLIIFCHYNKRSSHCCFYWKTKSLT